MLSAGKRKARVRTTVRGLALMGGMIALLGAAAPGANAQDPPPQDPGVTQRVFQLGAAAPSSAIIPPISASPLTVVRTRALRFPADSIRRSPPRQDSTTQGHITSHQTQ